MRRVLASSIAILTALSAAFAADLPQQQQPPPAYSPPPMVASPAYNWSGFYIGAMGGYGWSNTSSVNGQQSSADLKGGFAGGTVGFNYQAGPLVVGVEADGAWADIQHSTLFFVGLGSLTLQDRIQGIGSVTGRLGVAANNLLIYGKGGYAWADNQVGVTGNNSVSLSESHFHNGWTVGGGAEVGFAPGWSTKVEYMYARYLEQTYTLFGASVGANVQTVKVGVNYRFGWAQPPVAARY